MAGGDEAAEAACMEGGESHALAIHLNLEIAFCKGEEPLLGVLELEP